MFNKLSDADIEAFDKHIQGKMSEEEQNSFQQKLANDTSLRDSYLLYKMIVNKVKVDAEENEVLKQRLFKVSKRAKRNTWLKWLTGAAAILILAFLVGRFWQPTSTDYSKYLFDEPGLSIQMSVSNDNSWGLFSNEFAKKDYGKCLVLLVKIGSNDTATYYSGICNEYLNRNDRAMQYYQLLYSSPNDLLKNKSMFRSAILLLNKNENEPAIKLLNQLSSTTNNPYSPDAIKVLDAINGKK